MLDGATGAVSVTLVKLLLEVLHARGVEEDLILSRAGIAPQVLADIENKLPYEQMAQLWEAAEALTGDRGFPVHCAESLKPLGGYPCHYLMTTSLTVGEGLVRLIRYAQICMGGDAIRLDVGPSEARIVRRSSIPSSHGDEFDITFIMLRSRQGTGVDWTPTQLTLQHARDAGFAALLRVFRCPVTFGGEEVELRFPSEVLELSCMPADPHSGLFGLVGPYADELRKGIPARDSCISSVASTIAKQMSRELPTLASTARQLRLTERTLQRRLATDGVSYSELFDQVRRGLAMRFLGEQTMTIAQVGFLLHFSDESAFQRAFKRWTGATPGQYRRTTSARPCCAVEPVSSQLRPVLNVS